MANHGSKFVSVNLNKSYGQQHQPSHHAHYPDFNGGGGSYGPAGAGRGRPGSGGGGGMLVLSRARNAAPKCVPKLSVPPPLNLPSLRKEHEKFEILGQGGPGAGSGNGSRSRPTSSGMGWMKPTSPASALPEKNKVAAEPSGLDVAPVSLVMGSYMPPSARSSGAGAVGAFNADRDVPPVVDKAVLLRGDDFPSLQAVRPVSSGASQKQKDGLKQKQKVAACEYVGQDKEGGYHLGPLADTDRFPSDIIGNQLAENGGKGQVAGKGRMNDQIRKQEGYLSDPLPLVRMNLRSDWADDERDTGHGFVDQGRDVGYSNIESYWDRDLDLPRPSILPHKPAAQNQDDRWGQGDIETGKKFHGEVPRVDTYNKDPRVPSRVGKEVSKWSNSPLSKDGFSSQEPGSYRAEAGSRMSGNNNSMKENKYVPPHYGDTGRDEGIVHGKESPAFGKRESGLVGRQHQQGNNTMESFNNRSRHVSEPPHRFRGDNFQSNNLSRTSFASNRKMSSVAKALPNMGREKRFLNSERALSDDPFLREFGTKDFDVTDLFSQELVVGVIRRKKDASAKLTNFHDPVRESFEAELERVQKMQELERRRIIEEQEWALEQARREEEERQRRIREEEERRQKLEEEAREAAWRAEQERFEIIRKTEEQRIAREEEKKRIHLEEERRKQAAKQKLEELEARMAKRQAETSKTDAVVSKTTTDEKLESEVKERCVSMNLNLDMWEDSERMVENAVASGSFDLSGHSTPVEMSLRPYPPREGSSNFSNRGKANNFWKGNLGLENSGGFLGPKLDQDAGRYSPIRNAFGGGRGIRRKEFYGGTGHMPYVEELGYLEDHRWSPSPGYDDPNGKFREMNPEFHDSFADRYNDGGWGQGRPRVNTRPPYPEHLYPHPGSNDLYNYGRSRYSVRQPHVLLPPSLVPSQRLNPRVSDKLAGPPFFLDDGIHYDSNQGGPELSDIFGMQLENNTSEHQNLNNESRCYSQSSLSVSSPPTSPLHLSHDELDESGDSGGTSSLAEGKGSILSGTQSVACDVNSRNNTMLMVSDNVSAVEDEEWTVGNENTLQQQEEYDEDEDGYREEDEVRERDNENLELVQNFERLELEEDQSPHAVENVVLGFDEGVEVVIPRQDFEKTLSTEEKTSFEIIENAVNIVKESGIVDGFPSDPPHYLPADDSHGIITDSSANVPEKTASQGCIGQHIAIAASSDGTGLAAQLATSSTDAASQNSNNLPSLSSSGNQSDLPVKLQFGLFSGPSLIPSPLPAIQIGSIQMPLHIHPPLGQSMTTLMHPSQPSMFKFGQLHYTHPSTQGILPMAHQSMPFLQPNMLGHVSLNQNARDSVANEPSNKNAAKDEVSNILINHQPSIIPPSAEQSQEVLNTVSNATDMNEDTSEKTNLASGSLAEGKGQTHADSKCYSSSSSQEKASELESWHAQSLMQSVIVGDRNYGGTRGLCPLSGSKGRRFAHPVKNKYTRVSIQDHGMPSDSNRFQRRPRRTVQRTEFRVRENSDRRPPPVSSNNLGLDEKSNYNGKVVGVFARSGSKRGTVSNRTMKRRIESESSVSGSVTSQEVSGDRAAKELAKDMSQHASNPGEANLRKNASEEDVDAPLQSGVVHVFKQPGIEAPSDEDDFIEVRSKRQMLNDRREQREKEIKAKSRTTKPPRKPRASRPMDVVSRIYNKLPIPSGIPEAKSSQLEFTSSESPSTGYTIVVSQPLIGTLPISSDALSSNWSAQAGPVSVVSDGGAEHESGLNIDSKNKVMSLSQSQIDEAMKPARYDSHISTDESHSNTDTDPILPSSSILRKEKTFSSGSSPISSLLAGEKIQFGAVTSPTVLPPTTRAASHVIGAPGSNRPDAQKSCSLPLSEKDDSLFFSKEKPLNEPVQDCEAEAEAAASAVAVAAISSDEIVENGNDAKSFTDCVSGITTGAVGNRNVTSQSQSEESLSVSLPADLSVETTPISLLPPLPSPQNSSGQMLSHFPSGPPSHFPFYEMNPLVGGPIFTFSPHEESSGNQSQPPKNVVPASGPPLGNWTSGVDSFYGAPSGYPGPFISPHGGIPSVQGPTPHMVVYNHFAPVGQYAQVGLSFMGTTYIPSGKQGDWKNNVPASSAVHSGAQGDMNNVNVSNVQRGGPNMTPPIQHLASGSPLLHMPPPMPMFDVSPFQTASGLSAQARWGHIPSSPIPPVSRPPQSQTEGPLPPEVNDPGNSMDQSQGANRFIESHTPTQPDTKNLSFNVSSDSTFGPFPSQLGFSDPLRSVSPAPKSGVAVQTLPNSSNPENIKSDTAENNKPQNPSALKAQFPKKSVSSVQQGNNNYNNINNNNNNPSRYGYQRSGGMMSHRHSSGSDYSHRKMGYHGRNQSGGVNKGFHTSKVKQIYVAKQTNGTGPTA